MALVSPIPVLHGDLQCSEPAGGILMPYAKSMPLEEQKARSAATRRKSYEKNKPAILARQRAYRDSLPAEILRGYQKTWAEKNRESERLRGRTKNWKKHSLPTPTRIEPSICECCGRADRKALALDHCHATGAFRGWLCSRCNLGIGNLGDTIECVERALAYLKRAAQ